MVRQIAAALDGRQAPYDTAAMQRILATTEQAESDSRRAERSADDVFVAVERMEPGPPAV